MTLYDEAVALWRRKRIGDDAELAEALNGYRIAFAYHSGKLENAQITYHDTREIFEHDGVSAYTGDLRTLFEIRNAREAYELLLDTFRERRALDEALLKAFQFRLTQNTYDARRWQPGERPGEYKRHDFVTGQAEIGAPPEDVPEEVAELLADLADFPPGPGPDRRHIFSREAGEHPPLRRRQRPHRAACHERSAAPARSSPHRRP